MRASTYVTADLPGTGGRLRHAPEDFLVEELPLYEPSGAGDHLYLRLEKRGLTTHDAVHRLARALGRKARDVGIAGLKDARAVAVQTLSIEHVREDAAERAVAQVPGLTLLGLARHGNKLRLGHLRGNRFTIRVRDVEPDAAERATAVLDVLTSQGSPNWFGAQRFGMRGDNDVVGRALVRGDFEGAVRAVLALDVPPDADRAGPARVLAAEGRHAEALDALPGSFRTEAAVLRELARGRGAERAMSAVPRRLLRLYVSAYQSRLFNRLLAERLPAGLGRLQAGDLAFLHDRGAVFSVTDVAAEQPRADALAISPSAPLYGTRLTFAGGAPGERERALLASEGLLLDAFRVRGAGDMRGERRPLRVPLRDAAAEPAEADGGPALVVWFALPRGSFATAVLGEVLKTAEHAPPAA
jgi:tRNA pseudouridine13 synthase